MITLVNFIKSGFRYVVLGKFTTDPFFSSLIGRKNNNNKSFKRSGSTATVLSQQTESIMVRLSFFVN